MESTKMSISTRFLIFLLYKLLYSICQYGYYPISFPHLSVEDGCVS